MAAPPPGTIAPATRFTLLIHPLFRLGVRVVPYLPPAWGRRFADLGGLVAYAVARRARAAVRANLAHVLGQSAPEPLVRAVFRYGAYDYFDLLRLPGLGPDALRALVEVEGWEHLAAARAGGRGVLLVTAHLGSVSLVGQMVAVSGCPANVVVEPVQPPALLDLIMGLRASYGIRPLPAGPSLLRAIVAALGRNEVVGLVSDRDVLGSGIPTTFFGAPTRLPAGAAGLGLRTGAAVLPAFTVRRGSGRYLGWFEPPLPLVKSGDVRADIQLNTERITRVLETVIERHPEQWTVFQPVWPDEVR
jgi:phosphatidylinositol dimannoside acyltransferase